MSNSILKITLYAVVINTLLIPFSAVIASLFGYIMIGGLLCYCLLYPNTFQSFNGIVFLFVIVLILSFAFSLGDFETQNLQSLIKSLMGFVTFYWAVSFKNFPQNKMKLSHIAVPCILLTFIMCAFTFVDTDFRYTEINEWGDKIFTMGLGNPNATSMYVLFNIAVLLLLFVNTNGIVLRIMNIILICLNISILIMLDSRTAQLMLFLMLIVLLFRKKLVINQLVTSVVLIAPLVMLVVELFIVQKFTGLQFLGESWETGRFEIYNEFLENIKSMPVILLWGNLGKYVFSNLHNGILTIVSSSGLVGLALYWMFWKRKMKYIQRVAADPNHIMAYYFVVIFLLNASAESMMVIGTVPFSIFMVTMIKIAQGDVEFTTSNTNNVKIKLKWR